VSNSTSVVILLESYYPNMHVYVTD